MFMYFLHSSLAENQEQVIGVVRYRTLYIYIYIYRTIELYIYIYIYIYIYMYIYIYIYIYTYMYIYFPLFPISSFQITRRFKIG